MFDVGASELLLVVIVAIVVIGPKDMPAALRTAGRWIGKMRRLSGHFRAGIDAMVREAELEEMERKWREQNEAIMKAHPQLPTVEEMAAPTRSPEAPAEEPAALAAPAPASPASASPAPASNVSPAADDPPRSPPQTPS